MALASVIVAVKDSARFLAQAMDSIAAQQCEALETIVVDGGSRDASLEIAARYPRVRILPQDGSGFANAWNTGIRASNAGLIAFLDSDDVWMPGKIAEQLQALERAPNAVFAAGRTEFFLEAGCALPRGFRPGILQGSHAAPFCGAMLVRRSAIDDIGLLDESLRIASDLPWLAKLRELGPTVASERVLLRKRLHEGNLGHATAWPLFRSELLRVARERVQAARQAAS